MSILTALKKILQAMSITFIGGLHGSVLASETTDLLSLSLEQLMDIRISTGTLIPLNKAPAVASLITTEDIRAMGATTIDQVLGSVPGLHVVVSALNRTKPVYTFRGVYSGHNSQVLFMLNGYRIYGDLYNAGITHMSQMKVNNIARIEIVRGPGSAIYGADAYSGVINIITKSANEMEGLQVGLRSGSQNTRNIWLQYGANLDAGWQVAANLEYFKHDADRSRLTASDFQSNLDKIFGSEASLSPSYLDDRTNTITYNLYLNNDTWKLGIDGYTKHDVGVGAGAAQTIDHEGSDSYDQYLVSISYNNDDSVKGWQFETKFSYFYANSRSDLNVFPPGAVLPVGNDGNIFTPHNGEGCLTANIPDIGCVTTFSGGFIGSPNHKSRLPSLDVTAHFSGTEDNQIRIGIGIKTEKLTASETKNFGPGVLDYEALNGNPNPVIVDNTLTDVTGTRYIYMANQSRKVTYLSLQDIWKINNNWTLTSGVRFDNYEDIGNTTNPRVALVWNTSEKLTTKFLYGEAFRAPSFSELYVKNNPVILGNSDLKPEKIRTSELSFNHMMNENFYSNFNLYYYQTKDMIEVVTNLEGVSRSQNNKNLTGKGFELELGWQPYEVFKLSANYANQSTKNKVDNKQVEYVPQKQFYLGAQWDVNSNWKLSSQLEWVMDRERSAGDLRDNIGDYKRVNLTLRRSNWSWGDNKNWEFSVSAKNLFNQDIFEPTDGRIPGDYRMHGRRVYLELVLKL